MRYGIRSKNTRKVAKEMLRENRAPRDVSEQMILNNYRTMQFIREIKNQTLTPELVFEIHRAVTEDTMDNPHDAGRCRTSDNVRVYENLSNEVLHTPPPSCELPERMKAMCDFANGETPEFFIHPVVRAIILHFWLAYDHPFTDGKGILYYNLGTDMDEFTNTYPGNGSRAEVIS